MIVKTADFIAKHMGKFVLLVAMLFLVSYTDLIALSDVNKQVLSNLSFLSVCGLISMVLFFVGATGYRIHMLSENPEFDRF